ncbi:MAG: ABC transporter permease [Moorella humiferrea]|nr:ABC transporter permease [Moorella humiferrea]
MIRLWRRLRSSPAAPGYLLLLLGIIVNILVQGPDFFTSYNFNSLLAVNAPLVLAAIAQTVVVLTGGIDLSIGSSMTLVNTVAIALTNQGHWPVGLSWAVALAAATLVGTGNGLMVAYLRIPPLLATFASMSVVGGLALWIWPKPGGMVPREIYTTYGAAIMGIPVAGWIIIAVALLWLLISRQRVGIYLRAVGGRERSAYASGINTAAVKFFAYTFCGFITGVAGLCLTALTASGDPKIGQMFGLNSVAAVILGGSSLAGGWGSIGGSIAGALFLGLINNIVFFLFRNYVSHVQSLTSVASFYQQLLANLIVILGLASAALTQRGGALGGLGRRRRGGRTQHV